MSGFSLPYAANTFWTPPLCGNGNATFESVPYPSNDPIVNKILIRKIWAFHGGHFEECRFLGCGVV
jgi:hypothetical protein